MRRAGSNARKHRLRAGIRRLAPHAARRFERTQAPLAGRDMAACAACGAPVRTHASTACASGHGCVAIRWKRGAIHPGLQAKLACVQVGARHAAQACQLSPSLRLCLHNHNRTLYPVQLRFLAACRTSPASAPEVLLAVIATQSRINFEGYGSTFESALCQKAVRPCGLRNATASAALRPLPMKEPLAARRALQSSSHTTHLTRKVRQAARFYHRPNPPKP